MSWSRHGSGPGSVKARAAALEATAPASLSSSSPSSSSSSSSSSLSTSPLLVSAAASPLFTAMSRAQPPFVARPTAPGPPDMSRGIDASATGTQPLLEDALGRLSRATRPLRESVLKYMTDNDDDDDDDGVEGRSSNGIDVDSYTGPSYVELIRVPTQSSVSSTRSNRTALANFELDQRPRSGSKNDLENILGLNNENANDDDVDGIDDDDRSLQYLVVDSTLDPNEYLRWHDSEEEEEDDDDDDDDNQVHGVGENHEQGQDQDQRDQERQPAFFEPSTLPPPIPAVHAQGWARAHLRSSATNGGISGSSKSKVKGEDRERSKDGPKRKKSGAGSSKTKRSGSLRRTSTQSHTTDPADIASSLIYEATAALMTTNTSTTQLLPSPTFHTPSPSSFFWHDDQRNSAVDPSVDSTEFSTLGSPTVSSTSTVSVRHSLTSPAPSASSLSLSTRSNSTVMLPSPMRSSSPLYRTTPASAAIGSRRLATAREPGVVGSAPVTVQRSSASSPLYHVQQAAAAPVHETNGRRKRDPRQ
ncbi:hypothetical protein BGZ98_008803 [Dissophora globulifera]|nr:hypothetical protein BGZ98_008803 [Dissophora globulifera]